MIKRLGLFLLIITGIFYGVAAVGAQDSIPTDNEINEIAKQLYCPVCPNTPLDVCETKACQDWRAQIKDQLIEGWNEEQIIAYFVEQYGERVLAEPGRRGFTSLVWVLPVMAVLLGLVVVGQAIRGWLTGRQAEPATGTTEPRISPETLSQIEQDLRQLG